MTNEELMRRAIETAKHSKEALRCGVVIARDGEIIAEAYNQQRETHNATAHAEILAVSQAGQKLGNKNLNDCVIYCTCEPCTMCLSAILFAKISKLYFGVSLSTASPDYMPIALTTEELLKSATHKLQVIPEFLKEEAEVLLNL